MRRINLFLQSLVIFLMFSISSNAQVIRFFASKGATPGEKGFYLFDLNLKEGKFNLLSATDAGPNPSYFCISKKNGLIYAGNEMLNFKGQTGGGVTTLRYDAKTGVIEKIKEFSIPNGTPCFISLSPDNDFLLLASYTGGSFAVVKLDAGGIPVSITDTVRFNSNEGKVSHAHMIAFNPAGNKVYLTDLGLDKLIIYNFDRTSGRLQEIQDGIIQMPAGTGPRHFVFSSNGKKMYVIGELNSSVTAFDVDTNGKLMQIQTVTTFGTGYSGQNDGADIHIGKNDNFLYASNRGENSIVTFKIGSDGKLTTVGRTSCGGNWPRNFVIDPSGKYLLVGNQKSGNISLFGIDNKTGLPIDSGKEFKITSPSCLKFIN